ncbi:3-oxoacyl-ACP synthase [uncultured Lacinutrix sp.]|uniref:3-oxoacyl-ACP synthase n=1 Tax=uncultured Lacinutrix sp. TaxID=574032 RepID=UPI00262E87DD|nr:3-oxoacyl-ACP synthase [uncultured Lacinutrix sp.]
MNLKEELYNQCLVFIDNRLITVQNTMQEIQESLLSETKSSAGDKHETGRAMLQLEREKAGNQLAEINKTKANLVKINIETTSQKIHLGSIVYTTQANYFIAISAGILTVKNEVFYAISPSTPIAQLLLSKTKGDKITFRTNNFSITKVI